MFAAAGWVDPSVALTGARMSLILWTPPPSEWGVHRAHLSGLCRLPLLLFLGPALPSRSGWSIGYLGSVSGSPFLDVGPPTVCRSVSTVAIYCGLVRLSCAGSIVVGHRVSILCTTGLALACAPSDLLAGYRCLACLHCRQRPHISFSRPVVTCRPRVATL